MVSIKANSAQMKAIRRKYEKMQRRVKHGSPFFNRAALAMHRDVIRHFRDEKGSDGSWKPLKKPRRRGGSKLLQDTGTLRNSVIFQGRSNNALVRTSVDYASHHNDGTKNIPQREFMWLEKEVERKLLLQYGKFIVGGI